MTVADGFCTPHTAAQAAAPSPYTVGSLHSGGPNFVVGSIQFGADPSPQRPVYSEGRKVIVTDDLVERITRAAWEVVIEACGGDQSPNVWAFDTLAKVVRAELER